MTGFESTIRIRDRTIGHAHPCYVIAELGINHNGSMDLARRLVDAAAFAGCDAVKTQARTVDAIYTADELDRLLPDEPAPPNGWRTRGDYVRGRELSAEQHAELAAYAHGRGLAYGVSCWDVQSVERIEAEVDFHKVASPMLTDVSLIYEMTGAVPVIASTGMSGIEEIDAAVETLRGTPFALLHCVSAYPAAFDSLNLRAIATLRDRYGVPVGYSGHERGIAASTAAVAMGACILERHLTLDRSMWGSDQAMSLEPDGLLRLVRDVRAIEAARGDGVKRVHASELASMKRLRRSAS